MNTAFHIPAFPLNQFIDNFYYYADYHPAHSIDRFLPDGEVQLIFDFTDEPKFIYDNDTLEEIQACSKAWFSGFRTEPITIPSGQKSEMLIVQFKKGRVLPFVQAPMFVLTNTVLDAERIVHPDILQVRERLMDCKLPQEKFIKLEAELLTCYLKRLQKNPFIDFAVSQIVASPNQYGMKELASKSGYSQKHLIRLFKEHVGVAPKDFLKVIRFQQAIRQIELMQDVSWSALANDCGFYDQSHFIADFKAFSGFTPTAYLRHRGDLLNYIPVK